MRCFTCFASRKTDAERPEEQEIADKHRRLSDYVRYIFDSLDFGLCGLRLRWDPVEYDHTVGMKENARSARPVLAKRFEGSFFEIAGLKEWYESEDAEAYQSDLRVAEAVVHAWFASKSLRGVSIDESSPRSKSGMVRLLWIVGAHFAWESVFKECLERLESAAHDFYNKPPPGTSIAEALLDGGLEQALKVADDAIRARSRLDEIAKLLAPSSLNGISGPRGWATAIRDWETRRVYPTGVFEASSSGEARVQLPANAPRRGHSQHQLQTWNPTPLSSSVVAHATLSMSSGTHC